MALLDDIDQAFAQAYPDAPARLRHRLSAHPRLTLEAICALAGRLPRGAIESNLADLPISHDPAATPLNGLTPEETIQRIRDCRSWIVLKHVEQDPAYDALLRALAVEIAPQVRSRTGRMGGLAGFIFVSSPGSVTPFHMDPEHNILLQIDGRKTMRVFPRDFVPVPAERHEEFHAGAAHRNLDYRDAYDAHARMFDLAPGEALYVPVKAPHWVQNANAPSISLSLTWRSDASEREARTHRANRVVRRWGGAPPEIGARPIRDGVVRFAYAAASRFLRL